jgi:hypothetical protein
VSDRIPLFPEIGEVIAKRAQALGMSMAQVRHAMIENKGPVSADPIMALYAGQGTVRNATARALAAALQTTWLSIYNEACAYRSLKKQRDEFMSTSSTVRAYEERPYSKGPFETEVDDDFFGKIIPSFDDYPYKIDTRKPSLFRRFWNFIFGNKK